jgi:hypothetical protein
LSFKNVFFRIIRFTKDMHDIEDYSTASLFNYRDMR